jgi:outer membrane protein TolC
MGRFILFLIVLLLPCGVRAQLSLEECQERARANYPLARQHDLIEQARELDLASANKGYLPRLSLAARATYQSDVTRLPVALPGVDVKELSRDQYQAVVELSQTLWDGGAIPALKKTTDAAAATRQRQVDVDLHALEERVNQLFFGALLADEQLKYNQLLQEELRSAGEQVAALAGQGVAHAADVDAVRVEQARVKRQEIEARATRDACREMLGMLTGETIRELVKPAAGVPSRGGGRPELTLFQARRDEHATRLGIPRAGRLPRVSLFVQGGYGNPGLNMLKGDFSAYYTGGIRLSWNISNLYTLREERRQVALQQETVDAQRDAFLLNLSVETARGEGEVEKWRSLLVQDDEIVTLQERIAASAAARVREGTTSVLEWMREVNRLDQARQARVLHEMQWLLAVYTLKQVRGE